MKAKHKAYENAVSILSRRLQEALTDKEAAEAELAKIKAQVSDGGNTQALQVVLYSSLVSFVYKNQLLHIMTDVLESEPVRKIFHSYFKVGTARLHLFLSKSGLISLSTRRR